MHPPSHHLRVTSYLDIRNNPTSIGGEVSRISSPSPFSPPEGSLTSLHLFYSCLFPTQAPESGRNKHLTNYESTLRSHLFSWYLFLFQIPGIRNRGTLTNRRTHGGNDPCAHRHASTCGHCHPDAAAYRNPHTNSGNIGYSHPVAIRRDHGYSIAGRRCNRRLGLHVCDR